MTTLTKPTADQSETFAAWRTVALIKMPYMASLLYSLRVLDAPGLGTFAVDGFHRMYVDFDAVESWGVDACAQVLLHEVGHVFGEHLAFAEDFGLDQGQRRTWNAAADMALNDDLVQAGCDYIESTGLLPRAIGEPDFQTPLHYFEVIAQKQQQQQGGQDGSGQGEDQGGSGQGQNQGQGGQNNGQDGSGQGQGGQGQGQGSEAGSGPFRGCGSGSGGEAAPGELDGDEDFDGAAPGASSAEQQRVLIATAARVREHASRGRGTVPGGLVEQAEALLKPSKTPWQRIVGAVVRRAVRTGQGRGRTAHTKRDRRRHNVTVGGRKVIYPGKVAPKVSMVVVRDTSGSMGRDEIDTVTNEVVAISKRLSIRGDQLRVMDADAAAYQERSFTGARSMSTVTGGGGTDMRVGIQAALDLPDRPDVIVVVTDGGTPWPAEQTPVPVVACLVGSWAEATEQAVPEWMPRVVIPETD